MWEKIKLPLLVILVGALGFGLGRLSRIEEGREPIKIRQPEKTEPETMPLAKAAAGAYVSSKNGTKYYLAWCAGASRIKTENKVYFADKAAAEKAGYSAAANCPGI